MMATRQKHSSKQEQGAVRKRRTVRPVVRAADYGVLQRAVANPDRVSRSTMLSVQRAFGNRAVTRLLSGRGRRLPEGGAVQAKLTVGPAGDVYEQEADRVASQVVGQLGTLEATPPAQPRAVQREKAEDEGLMTKRLVQRRVDITAGVDVVPDMEEAISRARGGGRPLADNIRGPMERAYGADFGGVRVHTDAQADQLNRSIQARSFTTGQDVFFRRGAYSPASREGQTLLAHELTHVVQQNGPTVQREGKAGRPPSITPAHSKAIQRLLVLDDAGIDYGLIIDAYKVLESDPQEDSAMLMSKLKKGYKYKKGERLRLIGHGAEDTREFGSQDTKTLIDNLKKAKLLKSVKGVELMACFLGGGSQVFAKKLAKALKKDAILTAYQDTNVTYKTGESLNLPETKGELRDYARIQKTYGKLAAQFEAQYKPAIILGQIKGKTPKRVAANIVKLAKEMLKNDKIRQGGKFITDFYDELYQHHKKFAWKKRGVVSKPASKW
jgi:hypothetical protein